MKWALKIAAKILLSRLPIPYAWWQYLGIFRHGRMDHAEYALKIFRLHSSRVNPHGLPFGTSVLELGPGDSIATAIIASAHGSNKTWLVDVGSFARRDTQFYKAIALALAQHGLLVRDLTTAETFDDILKRCHASYLVNGLDSLKEIPDGIIDFAWSHSVLEHVRKHQVADTLHELFRIMKPGAYTSHNIDYQDHLSGELNSLRFPDQLWESDFFASSGFYTNRIPAVVMHEMFRSVGFEVIHENFGKWPSLPIKRKAITKAYRSFSDSELINRTSSVLLRKPVNRT